MSSLLNFYQHLPEHINPIVFSVGSFSVRWYSIMYLVAFATVYFLLSYRIRKKENLFEINKNQLANLLIYLIIGLLVGARLGYILFYDFSYFLRNPLEIFLPFHITGCWLLVTSYKYVGLSGMSYFGGLAGVVVAGYIFSKKQKLSFWKLADFIIPAIPAGYFFGRVGNFLNDELYGRATDVPWGMYFSADPLRLRHPSQLYEAFFEGLVLFLILWLLRNKSKFSGQLLCLYFFGYGFFRFFIEFFREPDPLRLGSLSEASPQIGLIAGFLTLGQIFSLALIIFSVFLWYNVRRTNRPIT